MLTRADVVTLTTWSREEALCCATRDAGVGIVVAPIVGMTRRMSDIHAGWAFYATQGCGDTTQCATCRNVLRDVATAVMSRN